VVSDADVSKVNYATIFRVEVRSVSDHVIKNVSFSVHVFPDTFDNIPLFTVPINPDRAPDPTLPTAGLLDQNLKYMNTRYL
jgi:hypothetical protein